MEPLLKDLKEKVTCSYCQDILKDPKTITCLHTFCCECLKEHALTSKRNGTFRCPECQAEVVLPEANRFDRLPTSLHHNRLLSLLAESADANENSCGICKKKKAEISFCFHCTKFMCSDCVNAHQMFSNLTEGHKVTPVKQFQEEECEALIKQQSFCSQQNHERQKVSSFCLKCELCVCQICIDTEHKPREGHNVELLDKVVDGEKDNIVARAQVLKGKIRSYGDAIRKLEQSEPELKRNITSSKKEVAQIAEQMIAKIRKSEVEIITALDNICVSRSEMLHSAKAEVQSLLKQTNHAVEFAEYLVQRTSSWDIMQSKPQFEQRYLELKNTRIPEIPVSSFVKYLPNSERERLSVGVLATSEPIIKGLTQNFEAGVESEFEVQPRMYEEQVYGMQCKVLVEPVDKVGSLTTCKKENGDLQVKFTPEIPGSFNITVEVNGKELTTSPYTIEVKQRLIHFVGELELKGETVQEPVGIAVNSKGLIAVADSKKHRILIFDLEGNCVKKLSCHGKKVGHLDVSYLNDDNILVADELNHCIQQFNIQTGSYVKSLGQKGTKDGEFQKPTSVCVDDEGRVVVADNNRVQVLSQDGEPKLTFGDSAGPGKLDHPTACIYHENKFIVSDWDNHCLKVFDNYGKFLYKIGEQGDGDGQFHGPWGLCVQKCTNYRSLLACNKFSGHVDQFTVEGCFTGKTLDKFQNPTGITTTPDGLILVSDSSAQKIYILK